MRVVRTIAELAEELAAVSQAGRISDAARRERFKAFCMDPPNLPEEDPDDPAYRRHQLDLYATIAGKSYSTANERTLFDVNTLADKPFPYLNEGWEVTGDQLIAVGWLFKVMQLPPKASVLEFGPGWGNATLALAQNGYQVTAVEIEPNFVDLVRERARRLTVPVEVVQGDFFTAAGLGRTFDAVLFFESFHHCSDHNALLDLLKTLVAPNGVVVFGAEPIDENFGQPWGLRLDGQSLWAIRKHGWLELGFTETYFVRSLMRRGFVVEKLQSSASPLASCFRARKAAGVYELGSFYLPPAEDLTWAQAESDPGMRMRFTGGQSIITLEQGGDYRRIDIALRNFAPFDMEVEARYGLKVVSRRVSAHSADTVSLSYDPEARMLTLTSMTWRPSDQPGMGPDGRLLGIGVSQVTLL